MKGDDSHEKTLSASPMDQATEVHSMSLSSRLYQMRSRSLQRMHAKQAQNASFW